MAVRVYKGGEYRRWDLLGLSCFCGWVYASFFTKAISLKGPAGTMVLDGFWLASLFSVTVGLGLGVAMPRIAIRLAENQAGRTGAAVFMVIGTLMMSLSTLIDMSPFKALGLVGAVLSGFGAAVLYFAWGRAYALAGGEATEWAIPFSLCLAMVIALAASGMNAWVSSAVVALLPAISAGLLAFSFRRALKAPQVSQKTRSAKQGGGSSVVPMLRSCLVLTVAWFVFTLFRGMVGESASLEMGPYLMALLFGTLGALVISRLFIDHARSMSMWAAWKLVVPLTCFSLLLYLVLPDFLAPFSYSLAFAGLICFDICVWVSSVEEAVGDEESWAREIGFPRFATQLGGTIGALAVPLAAPAESSMLIPALMALLSLTIPLCNAGRVVSFGDVCEGEFERQLTHEERCLLVSERYGLSEREAEVLELVGKGRDLPYIRDHLFISRNTVNTHIKHIYAKTGVHSKQELLTLLERQ